MSGVAMVNAEVKRWMHSFALAALFFVDVSFYLYLRRGIYSLGNGNKALAYTAFLLAGLTLIIRPLSTKSMTFARLMSIRRQLGLWAFIAACVHIIISIFFIPTRFTIDWYKQEWVAISFGVVAIGIWLYLTFISRNLMIVKLGNRKWRTYQSWGGKIAFLLVYLHLIHLKYSDWVLWITGQLKPASYLKNPAYVPESLIVFVLMSALILYRLFHDLGQAGKETPTPVQLNQS